MILWCLLDEKVAGYLCSSFQEYIVTFQLAIAVINLASSQPEALLLGHLNLAHGYDVVLFRDIAECPFDAQHQQDDRGGPFCRALCSIYLALE